MRFSVWELLLILVIVLVLFGGARLRNLGGDLGAAIRGFRDAMREGKEGKSGQEAAKAEDAQFSPLFPPAADNPRPEAPTAAVDLKKDASKI